jgi:hypothetical protein
MWSSRGKTSGFSAPKLVPVPLEAMALSWSLKDTSARPRKLFQFPSTMAMLTSPQK